MTEVKRWDPHALLARYAAGDATVRDEVQQWVAQVGQQPRDHRLWGQLCEMVGLSSAAVREYDMLLRQHPRDVELLRKVAQLHDEHGDLDAASQYWQRLLEVAPGDAVAVDELIGIWLADGNTEGIQQLLQRAGYPPERAEQWRRQLQRESHQGEAQESAETASATTTDPFAALSDADCVRFAALFAGREDVYARQWHRPQDHAVGYTPVYEPLTPAVIRQHLLGAVTVGVYPIRLDQTALWFAIDLDITRAQLDRARRDHAHAQHLRRLMRDTGIGILLALRRLGLEPLFENSGYKGRHYWVFLERPYDAAVLHHLGRRLVKHLHQTRWSDLARDDPSTIAQYALPQDESVLIPPEFSLEFFPKQGKRSGKGLGNLIKLPLGVHQRTGHRSMLLADDGTPCPDPLDRLKHVQRLGRPAFDALVDRLNRMIGTADTPSDRNRDEAGGDSEQAGEEGGTATPPLWPPDVPPPWTEADFETDAEVRHLLKRCPVLAELRRVAEEHRQLSHDEQVVLAHTLGHLPSGPQAVNYMVTKCVEFSPDLLLKSPLQGNPISCPKIRKRIGHVTRRVPCSCDFSFAPNHYPTPVLHLQTLTEADRQRARQAAQFQAAQADQSLEATIRRYTVLMKKQQELERELQQVHDHLCRALAALPQRSVETEKGRFYLEMVDGIETLRWESAGE